MKKVHPNPTAALAVEQQIQIQQKQGQPEQVKIKVSDTGSKKIPEGADISGNRGYRKISAGYRPKILARI